MNQLQTLKQYTTVVADTGDFKQLVKFLPQDATTNPSLILKAVQKDDYRKLLVETVEKHKQAPLDEVSDYLLVHFGCEILDIIPGRVSTEVDARLSFDTQATIDRAKRLIAMYKGAGIDKSRILIKIASTWEGIQAAKALELQGIHTNLTLLFSFGQAVACGHANVKLISPFVGRIYDWHKKSAGSSWIEEEMVGASDPGVKSVRNIYNYYKKMGISTEVMGASFRNVEQIIALAGCDFLTISPDLLSELKSRTAPFSRALFVEAAKDNITEPISFDESSFRLALNQDEMASDKLAEGIRVFCVDALKLDALLMAN